MRQKSVHPKSTSERIVKNIRRATRKHHSSEEKIRIVLARSARRSSAHPRALSPRLAKDWENFNRKALGFLRLASIRLMLRKLSNQS